MSFIACRRKPSFFGETFWWDRHLRPLRSLGRSEHVPYVPSLSFNNTTAFRHASLIASSSNKMWILPLVGYIGLAFGFGFLTLAIGTFLPSPRSWMADAYRLHSVRTLLPLRARRRTYCVCQEISHAPHLLCHWRTGSTLPHRWLPFLVVPPQHRLTCRIPWQHAAFSNRQAFRPSVHNILRYALLSAFIKLEY